jgi:hypothetical protein
MTTISRTLAAALALTLPACVAPAADEPSAEARQAMVEPNGTSLNGRSLNGRSLNGRSVNGRSINGRSLNGVALNGATLDGVALDAMSVDGSLLRAEVGGEDLAGRDLVGARLTGILDDASTLVLRLNDVRKSKVDHDTYLYTVSFEADGGAYPLCVDELGLPVEAIALAGRWSYAEGESGGGAFIDDPAAFTFACRGYAIAKCVELGYAPWRTVRVKRSGTVSLADHHQACTRAIRADYCGDGTSHTVDGTLIDIYDALGIQADTTSWSIEAEWVPGGARCVARERLAGAAYPACWSSILAPDCGDRAHFAAGALIMTEDAE